MIVPIVSVQTPSLHTLLKVIIQSGTARIRTLIRTKSAQTILLMAFFHPSFKGNGSALCSSLPAASFSAPLV